MISLFQEYMLFRAEIDEKLIIYKRMQSLVNTLSMISITRDSWRDIQMLWQQMELFVSFSIDFLNERTEFCVVTTSFRKYYIFVFRCYIGVGCWIRLYQEN